jgi:hypothetical protein
VTSSPVAGWSSFAVGYDAYGIARDPQADLHLGTDRFGLYQGHQHLHEIVIDYLPVIPAVLESQAFTEKDDGLYRVVNKNPLLHKGLYQQV